MLMILVETSSAMKRGDAKAMTLKKPAGPSDIDSATIGRMNDKRMPTTHTAAFVAMSFFFSALVILRSFTAGVEFG